MLALRSPDGEGFAGVTVQAVEVLVGVIVGVVEHRDVVAGELDAEPPALDAGQVPHQAVQGQAGRRNRPFGQPLRRQAGALERCLTSMTGSSMVVRGQGLRAHRRLNRNVVEFRHSRQVVLGTVPCGSLITSIPLRAGLRRFVS